MITVELPLYGGLKITVVVSHITAIMADPNNYAHTSYVYLAGTEPLRIKMPLDELKKVLGCEEKQ